MSEPLRAWRGENQEPHPDLIPDKPAGDSDHADQGTRTNAWFHRTASRPALRPAARTRATPPPAPADDHASGSRRGRPAAPSARPGPMSKEERLSPRDGTHPLSLTWEQIDYFVARERIIDALFDEQYWHDTVLFDRAIDDDRYWRNGRLCDRPMDAEPEIDDPEIG